MVAQQGYNSNDFLNMQREAERRVMEMQKRAKNTVESNTPTSISKQPPLPSPAPKHGFLEMLNLKSLFEGKDTSLVLMVLALMNSEDTDPLLLLALLYVIM